MTELGADTAALSRWATTVEGQGYDSIVVYDHVVGAEHRDRTPPITRDYDETTPFREPLVLLGYLAATTASVELMTGILILPQRQTALVAKQTAEVALLSGDRLTLGVGLGWNVVEYETLGVPVADRGRRLDEQIDLLKALWSDELVSLDGRFHHVERVALSPRPARAIPLVFGGGSAAAVRRAVRVGDGFFFATPSRDSRDLHATLLERLEAAGRPVEEFRTVVQVHAARGEEDLKRSLEPWQGKGVDDVVIATVQNRMLGAVAERCRDIEEHLELLGRARKIVETVLGD
ncbi:TIGR03619 family F420-dependent LLM class oxidoreductase [Actinomycetospora atypica]|uniref:TIGR03619 family F420-dependent LLM class oxidoreductase n=2 Tax=Actinomycetospora atypica TaxID=1290095 RepID=A0ABV9YQ53_9PSEU